MEANQLLHHRSPRSAAGPAHKRVVLVFVAVAFAVAGGWVIPSAASAQAASEARLWGADAIAVCPDVLRPALGGWLLRRQREGLSVQVIAPEKTAAATKRKIAEVAQVGRTRYVVLIGDTQRSPEQAAAGEADFVPTIYQQADATAPWQSFPQLPGDYRYGDFDDDGVVNAAVGRLPVQTRAQAAELFARIAAYEDSRDYGRWRSRVDLVAGLGGFGPLIDGAIEAVASGMITGALPGSVHTRVTHAGPESMFCPGTDCFTDTVLANYADGARFWVYAGHGHVRELDRVPATPYGRPVLGVGDVQQLRRPADSAPIALLLACYTGAYDAAEDCLAKQMLLAPGGPVAVLAGSRVTMPYGNAAAAMGLIHAVYHQQPERLGDAWRETLIELATPSTGEPALQARRLVIDGLATLLGGGRIDEERREHMQLYNWLGDPTMRLAHPDVITIDPPQGAVVDQPLEISGSSPLAGKMTIELHRRLGTATAKPQPSGRQRAGNQGPKRSTYELANDTTVNTWTAELPQAGPWQVKLPLPADATGPMRLVASLQSGEGFASGSQTVWIRPTAAR